MLIKDVETIQSIVNSASSLDYDQLLSSIQDAEEEFIIPAIGQEQYDELHDAFEPVSPDLDAAQEKLLKKIQRPLAYFAMMLYLPEGMIKVTGDGVQIVSTEQMKTAWQWQTDKLEFKYLKSGYRALDALLEFLEENKVDYTTWAESDAYTESKEMLLPNAKTFSKYYDISNSRRMYMRVKQMMLKVEDFLIKPLLGETYFLALKEAVLDTVSADDQKVIKLIQKALAPLTIARALDEGLLDVGPDGVFINLFNDSLRSKEKPAEHRLQNASSRALTDGMNYLTQLRDFLNSEASGVKYADYFNEGPYSDPANPIKFNNSEDKSYFAAR